MGEAAPEQALLHAVFLRRLAEASSGPSSQARLGHGAFLTLRLVDSLDPAQQAARPDAFAYQLAGLDRACRQLPGDSTETAHLIGLMHATADAFRARDTQLVVPALLAYAHYLEDELLLEEALDVLDTALRVGGEALRDSDRVASRLRVARVLRKLNEFGAAEQAYSHAATLAAATGDQHSVLLSRIGSANTLVARGNLTYAERRLREILLDAEGLDDRDAQARAHQGLAVVLSTSGQPAQAIPHEWRAFQLYEDDLSRMRVLSDLGIMLLIIGDVDSAERALTEIVRSGANQDVVDNAMIELMNCASYQRDRVGFERWWDRCWERREEMPSNVLADFYLKAGIGRARFGQFDRAEVLLRTALKTAEGAGLHELVFRIERINRGLRDCCEACEAPSQSVAEPRCQTAGVREVSAALAHLAT